MSSSRLYKRPSPPSMTPENDSSTAQQQQQPGSPSPLLASASPIPSREQSPDLPLTLTASVILTSQTPRDALGAAAEAVAALEGGADRKVVVRFKPVGSAPAVRRELCKISAGQKFEAVVAYLRRVLKVGVGESVFLYVNSTFAPALDEVVGNLHRCFKDSNDQLNVSYSMTPAFG